MPKRTIDKFVFFVCFLFLFFFSTILVRSYDFKGQEEYACPPLQQYNFLLKSCPSCFVLVFVVVFVFAFCCCCFGFVLFHPFFGTERMSGPKLSPVDWL